MDKTAAAVMDVALDAMQQGQMVRLEVSDQQEQSSEINAKVGYITGIKGSRLTFTNMLNQSKFVKLSTIRRVELVMK